MTWPSNPYPVLKVSTGRYTFQSVNGNQFYFSLLPTVREFDFEDKLPNNTPLFSFDIEAAETNSSVRDTLRIQSTIGNFLLKIIQEQQFIIHFICQSDDGKALKRRKYFNRIYETLPVSITDEIALFWKEARFTVEGQKIEIHQKHTRFTINCQLLSASSKRQPCLRPPCKNP